MKLNLFIVSFFVGVSAFANFSGSWKGIGVLTHSTGQIENCALKIVIEQTAEVFLVRESFLTAKQ